LRHIEELNVKTVQMKVAQYKQKWLNCVSRMEDVRYPKQLLDYWSVRRRRLDGHSHKAITGYLLA